MLKICAHCKNGDGSLGRVRNYIASDSENHGYTVDMGLHPGCVGHYINNNPSVSIGADISLYSQEQWNHLVKGG